MFRQSALSDLPPDTQHRRRLRPKGGVGTQASDLQSWSCCWTNHALLFGHALGILPLVSTAPLPRLELWLEVHAGGEIGGYRSALGLDVWSEFVTLQKTAETGVYCVPCHQGSFSLAATF